MISTIMIALAIFALPVALFGALARPRWLVAALPFLVTLNGVPVHVGGVAVHIDQVAVVLLALSLGARRLGGHRYLPLDTAGWLIVALLGVNVVASAAESPVPGYSLVQCANLASAWGVYVIVMTVLDSRRGLERFVAGYVWAGIVGGALGIASYLSATLGLGFGGAEVSHAAAQSFTNAFGAYGVLLEPNIFGSFTAAYFVYAAGMLLAAAHVPIGPVAQRRLRWLAALSAVGLVLSFTRAAWLGAAAGLIAFALAARALLGMSIRITRWLVPLGVALATALLVLSIPGGAGAILRFKLANLVNLESPTALLRIFTYATALQQTASHPILGWGTFTFAPIVLEGPGFQAFPNWSNLWIGNFLVLALHDTGAIGLALWSALLAAIFVPLAGAARRLRGADPALASRTLALGAAAVALVIAFLATSGFSLGYPWLVIGLLGAHVRLSRGVESVPEALATSDFAAPTPWDPLPAAQPDPTPTPLPAT